MNKSYNLSREMKIQFIPPRTLLSAQPLPPQSHSPKRDSLAGRQQRLLASLSLSVNAWRNPALPHGPSTHDLLIDVWPCWRPLQSHFPQIWSDDLPCALPLHPRKTLIQTHSKSFPVSPEPWSDFEMTLWDGPQWLYKWKLPAAERTVFLFFFWGGVEISVVMNNPDNEIRK